MRINISDKPGAQKGNSGKNLEELSCECSAQDSAASTSVDASTSGNTFNSSREAAVAVLRMLAEGMKLLGTEYPQDMLDELDRAENDESIDIQDLADRFNKYFDDHGSHLQGVPSSQITFNNGNRVHGDRFSMMCPDGWEVINEYVDTTLRSRIWPLIVVPGEALSQAEAGENGEKTVSLSDKIMYNAGDSRTTDEEANVLDDLHWLFQMLLLYDRPDNRDTTFMPNYVWDTEVEAVNTKCLVAQQEPHGKGACSLEFDVYPYLANSFSDSLRILFSYDEDTDIESLRETVLKLAASIEADRPPVPDCLKTIDKALSEKIAPRAFVGAVQELGGAYPPKFQYAANVSATRHVVDTGNFDISELPLAMYRGIIGFVDKAVPKLGKILRAYDKQATCGHSTSELDSMAAAIKEFYRSVFISPESFFNGDEASIEEARNIERPDELAELQNKYSWIK